MTDVPEADYARTRSADPRVAPPATAGERETLTAFLDWHRRTFAIKCAGVPAARLSDKGVPPSGLSLHGLLRHLTAVERWWCELDFDSLDGDVGEAFARWEAECRRSRAIVDRAPSLDATGVRQRTGEPFSLRWALIDVIAEYVRHNGHADLLRERIDGATGY